MVQTCCTVHKVVVVGGGIAGLSAALEAAAHTSPGLANTRVQVTVLDKELKLGGNSVKDAGGIRWGLIHAPSLASHSLDNIQDQPRNPHMKWQY